MKRHFDVVIANPPYSQGNSIISMIVESGIADEYIVLMPLSCYKNRDLYRNVHDLRLVDPNSFKDAAITDNLSVCRLMNNYTDKSYTDLELETFDENLKDYYKLNISKISSNKFKLTNKSEILNSLDPELDFILPQKTSNDGVHKTIECIDYRWNFLRDRNALMNKNGTLSNIWINPAYHSSAIKNNLMTFWYKNPIVNSLLFGINSQYGDLNKSLPNINWSKNRDYEHATLEDIMNWLEEDNRE